MAKTLLRSLEIEAFKSFEKKARVEFPRSGLVLIRGVRGDGISSGTGKTTFLNAITHALKYCPESSTEIQSWFTDKPVRVELELEQDTIQATVARGSKSFVEFVDDGVGGRGSSRVTGAAAIDSHLEKFVGLPPELLAALTYRQQKSPGLFLSKSDSDKKSFLSLILGLTQLEDEVERAQDRIKGLEKELVALEAKRDARVAQLQQEISKAPSSDMVDVDALEKTLVTIRYDHEVADKHYREAKDALNKHLEDVERAVERIENDNLAELYTLRGELKTLEKNRPIFTPDTTALVEILNTLKEVENRLSQRRKADLAAKGEIQKKLDALRLDHYKRRQDGERLPKLHDKIAELRRQQNDSTCSQCGQPWTKSNVQYNSFNEQVSLIEAEISMVSDRALECGMIQTEIDKLTVALAEVDPIIPQLEKLHMSFMSKKADIQADMKVKESEFYADYNKRISDKKADIQAAETRGYKAVGDYHENQKIIENGLRVQCDAVVADVQKTIARISEMEGRINTAIATNDMRRDAIQAHVNSVGAIQTSVNAIRAEVEAKAGEVSAERDFVKLVGREGFLGNIFSEVLIEIATETNKILKNVPNVSHVTIKFRNENVTQKGSVKKVITPVVSIAGVERPLGAALSGGMRTAVDLAVDLATRRIVSRRSGHNPAWLILDEPFEGLSAIEKECILQILKGFAQDCLILVVDHATETKESFDKIIEISNHNGRSTLK